MLNDELISLHILYNKHYMVDLAVYNERVITIAGDIRKSLSCGCYFIFDIGNEGELDIQRERRGYFISNTCTMNHKYCEVVKIYE